MTQDKSVPMTYEGAGVDYNALDAFKRIAMHGAAATVRNGDGSLRSLDCDWSRGESAYAFRLPGVQGLGAFVVEGLGTKNLIAEDPALRAHAGGYSFYHVIGRDNVAMVLNDLITVGAMPFVFGLHVAVGDETVLQAKAADDLVNGTYAACIEAKCIWGPGETPTLKGIVAPGTMCLGGAAFGWIQDERHVMTHANVRAGLRIVLLGSSGIHANGLSLARRIATTLPEGYLTDIGDGIRYGSSLLSSPTCLYVEFVRLCQQREIPLAYAVNMTGHGWRKLMRAPQPLTYEIETVPKPQRIFEFMREKGPVDLKEMYATFNMGAGFAVFVEPRLVGRVLDLARYLGISAFDAGYIKEGDRKVVIQPHGIEFTELDLR